MTDITNSRAELITVYMNQNGSKFATWNSLNPPKIRENHWCNTSSYSWVRTLSLFTPLICSQITVMRDLLWLIALKKPIHFINCLIHIVIMFWGISVSAGYFLLKSFIKWLSASHIRGIEILSLVIKQKINKRITAFLIINVPVYLTCLFCFSWSQKTKYRSQRFWCPSCRDDD